MHPGVHSGDLNDVANNEDEDTEGHGLATSPPIGGISSRESTDQRTNAHQGHEKRLDDGHPFLLTGRTLGKALLEIGEQEHRRDLTGIVAEQETTNRGGDT